MRFMNDFDIDLAKRRFDPEVVPNRNYVAWVVSNLRDWADENSDGWPYWPKPVRAAARAFELLEGQGTIDDRRNFMDYDASDAEVVAALRPIKAFLTRQGVPHHHIIPED